MLEDKPCAMLLNNERDLSVSLERAPPPTPPRAPGVQGGPVWPQMPSSCLAPAWRAASLLWIDGAGGALNAISRGHWPSPRLLGRKSGPPTCKRFTPAASRNAAPDTDPAEPLPSLFCSFGWNQISLKKRKHCNGGDYSSLIEFSSNCFLFAGSLLNQGSFRRHSSQQTRFTLLLKVVGWLQSSTSQNLQK